MMDNRELEEHCTIDGETQKIHKNATEQLYLSPRACHRILKVSRTIADLEHADNIGSGHVAEAIAFRRLNIVNDSRESGNLTY